MVGGVKLALLPMAMDESPKHVADWPIAMALEADVHAPQPMTMDRDSGSTRGRCPAADQRLASRSSSATSGFFLRGRNDAPLFSVEHEHGEGRRIDRDGPLDGLGRPSGRKVDQYEPGLARAPGQPLLVHG